MYVEIEASGLMNIVKAYGPLEHPRKRKVRHKVIPVYKIQNWKRIMQKKFVDIKVTTLDNLMSTYICQLLSCELDTDVFSLH